VALPPSPQWRPTRRGRLRQRPHLAVQRPAGEPFEPRPSSRPPRHSTALCGRRRRAHSGFTDWGAGARHRDHSQRRAHGAARAGQASAVISYDYRLSWGCMINRLLPFERSCRESEEVMVGYAITTAIALAAAASAWMRKVRHHAFL
jgi:hypothetical protein